MPIDPKLAERHKEWHGSRQDDGILHRWTKDCKSLHREKRLDHPLYRKSISWGQISAGSPAANVLRASCDVHPCHVIEASEQQSNMNTAHGQHSYSRRSTTPDCSRMTSITLISIPAEVQAT